MQCQLLGDSNGGRAGTGLCVLGKRAGGGPQGHGLTSARDPVQGPHSPRALGWEDEAELVVSP